MIGLVLLPLFAAQSQTPQLPQQAYVSRSPTRLGDNMPRPEQSPRLDPASVAQMQAFGHCVAMRQPAKSAALLQMDFNTPQYTRALKKLASSESSCIGRSAKVRFAGVLFAGALAEQLLARTDNLAGALAYDPAKPSVKTFSLTDYVAACVARTSPEKVAALLVTPAVSEAEQAAISQLAPVVEQCVPAGQQARFNRPGLRAILAAASYRMVEAGRAVGIRS
ncbi:hypothetical protein [Sphingomonas xinjiangensis]|uniref:Uncharacterized protein n=1 Tax=Sphingomonas xinjiangensis TaxID=643568 RepID=A0A840YN96_9SPHN|nr:hypothetical protein [Sphingomonas xinjiangensis]MBB5711636.1 hypothetical protein [Sphingomonas xinjiangensis]